jgi:HEAT repeat protein
MKFVLAASAALAISCAAHALPRPPVTPVDMAVLKEHVRALEAGTEADQLRAVAAIKALGRSAFPAAPALTAAFRDSSPRVRNEIANTLATYGPAAKAAIPTLVEALRPPRPDSWTVYRLSMAIAALGDPGNREMVRAYLGGISEGRKVSCPVGELIDRYPAAVTPAVTECLADPLAIIRARAAQTLAHASRPPEPGKPSKLDGVPADVRRQAAAALRIAIEDPDPTVRSWGVTALINADPAALPAAFRVWVTLIRQGTGHSAMQDALQRRGPAAARLLIDYLDDPNPNVRGMLVQSLARIGDRSAGVLAAGLRHPNPVVRTGVLEALDENPARVAEMRVAVHARLADDDARVRLAAARVLVHADPSRARAAVPVLADAAFSRDRAVRLEALQPLAALGPVARSALPDLLRRVRSGDLETRFYTAKVLDAADHSTWPTFVPVFAEVARDGSPSERRTAAQRLGATGPDAATALPALRRMLTSDELQMNRLTAAEAIGRIAPDDAADAVGVLVDALGDPTEDNPKRDRFRRAAFRGLREIGPPAKAAGPALLEMMRAALDAELRAEAAVTIIAIEPDSAKPAYDAFRAHLRLSGSNSDDDDWLGWLPALGKAAKPLLPDLITALKGKFDSRVLVILEVLAILGPDAKDALPVLRDREWTGSEATRVREVIRAIEGKK